MVDEQQQGNEDSEVKVPSGEKKSFIGLYFVARLLDTSEENVAVLLRRGDLPDLEPESLASFMKEKVRAEFEKEFKALERGIKKEPKSEERRWDTRTRLRRKYLKG